MTGPENNAELVARLITATITNTQFLQGLKAVWNPALVGSGWRWIAGEAFKWLEEKGEAPGRNIELLWAAAPQDEDTRADIAEILERLSAEYEANTQPFSTQELLAQAVAYFERELYIQQSLKIGEAAEAGRLVEARQMLAETKPPQLLQITAISPALCPEAVREAFTARADPLVQLGGALQSMLGDKLVRDSLVVLLADEKAGKSYILQALEFGAMRVGSRVIAFQCGDLSRGQKIARMSQQLTNRSIAEKFCVPQMAPVQDCLNNQTNKCSHPERPCTSGVAGERVEGEPYHKLTPYEEVKDWYKPCCFEGCRDYRAATWWREVEACPPLTYEEALEVWARHEAARPGRFYLETFPNETATIQQMDTILTQLRDSTGWEPELIVVDYPDICAPEPGTGGKDYRHQENQKWMALRRLSQKWRCCVVAPTQAKENKKTKDRRLLLPNMFSEDKRKKAHPTDAFGINIDRHDKRRKVWRVNYLFGRDDSLDVEDQVMVLHCLERSQPNLGSFWYRRRRT